MKFTSTKSKTKVKAFFIAELFCVVSHISISHLANEPWIILIRFISSVSMVFSRFYPKYGIAFFKLTQFSRKSSFFFIFHQAWAVQLYFWKGIFSFFSVRITSIKNCRNNLQNISIRNYELWKTLNWVSEWVSFVFFFARFIFCS